ncbi:branched-chain amino acid transport system II carrier protein [Atopobacter sp. AH10]|uniref:branched-chain amino acid transport system II carrier protein n=1 Tax=Atopobacter sp. AH10 TaxID=2315861 RepID=UPI000EF1C905|nr:branched-chain amino acid transport system II carrier protein [Atopobacter sp. AH10]RLK63064.1 branched-chain amino acid transport system II carrier protein [Atopobacter sp. AH10]
MKIKTSDILIIGFALFAIFFGAGNLIFPPYLGYISGEEWYKAAFGFLTSDPFFPILGVLGAIQLGGAADVYGQRIHPRFGQLIAGVSIILIGPLFSVPRTGATTHEIFVQAVFPAVPAFISSLIFFSLTAYLSLNPSKIVHTIGKYLTPLILLILALLVSMAILHPAKVMGTSHIDHAISYGFKEGYQTMDALGTSLLASIVMNELRNRGYRDKKLQMKAGALVGLVALVLLALVYLSLAYAGASVSGLLGQQADRTSVFSATVSALLGQSGNLIMGICVALACLTTAIGLTSAFSNFFVSLSGGKLSYKRLTLLAVSIEFVISLIGTERIITIAAFVLTAIYPIVMTLILMAFIDRYLPYRSTYIGAVIGAAYVGLTEALISADQSLAIRFPSLALSKTFPLNNYGLEWLCPAILLGLLFTLLHMCYQKLKKVY